MGYLQALRFTENPHFTDNGWQMLFGLQESVGQLYVRFPPGTGSRNGSGHAMMNLKECASRLLQRAHECLFHAQNLVHAQNWLVMVDINSRTPDGCHCGLLPRLGPQWRSRPRTYSRSRLKSVVLVTNMSPISRTGNTLLQHCLSESSHLQIFNSKQARTLSNTTKALFQLETVSAITMPWNPQRLTVLITGSSSGLGLALTRNILSHGHHVIATSRTPAKTPDLVAEVEAAGGQWLALDLDDPDCGAVIARLEDQGTHVDVLTNAAGFSILGASEAFAEDEVRRQMETSFFGPYRLMRAVVPRMRERRRGMIVNLSSGAGCYGREAMAIYGASKSAMDGT